MGFHETTIKKRTSKFISNVVLKRLENVENANKSWLEEVCSLSV